LEAAGIIIANFSDIPGLQAQPLASDERCGHLPSRLSRQGYHAFLSTQRRKFADHQDRVCGVQAEAYNVRCFWRHLIRPGRAEHWMLSPMVSLTQ
jgi:hypothetical protein